EGIKEKVGRGNVAISVCYAGVVPPSYPINNVYLWTSGPEEAVLRVALRPGSGVRIEELKERLRRELPPRLEGWLQKKLLAIGRTGDAAARAKGVRISFEPADIVNEVMSFGSPAPVEVAVSGPQLAVSRAYAEKVRRRLERIDSLRDLQFV